MKTRFRGTLALIVPLLLLGACGPRIGVKTDFQQQAFQVGKTTRADVIKQLGLPQQILKDSDGREHLLYEGSTRLVGMCVGCGDVTGNVGIIPRMMNDSRVKNGAEYVFDLQGVLVTKFEPPAKGK